VERLISLAYPSAGPSVRDVLEKDSFIDAVNDPELEFKVREKEPKDFVFRPYHEVGSSRQSQRGTERDVEAQVFS